MNGSHADGGGGNREYSDANRYAASLYLDVTSDASRWKGGAPAIASDGTPSKLNQALAAGKGLAIDRSLPTLDIAVIGVQPRKEPFLKDVGFGPMHRYIDYIIKVTRLRDGATSVVCHRYSALRAFHEELLELGIMKHLNAPEFPRKKVVSEETFLLERADTNSTFIKLRREELHHFLRRLFNHNPDLWEQDIVKNFFNLQSLDVGRKYAERSRAMTEGSGAGGGFAASGGLDPLSHYNSSDPAQWNPYTMAMQASEASKVKNYPQPPSSTGGGGGIANGGRAGSGGSSGNGADAAMVRSLCELGFAEDLAATALRAAGNNPDLAAEYCMSGIPPAAQAAADAAAAAPPPLPPKEQPKRGGGWFGLGRKDAPPPPPPAPAAAMVPPQPASSGGGSSSYGGYGQHPPRRHSSSDVSDAYGRGGVVSNYSAGYSAGNSSAGYSAGGNSAGYGSYAASQAAASQQQQQQPYGGGYSYGGQPPPQQQQYQPPPQQYQQQPQQQQQGGGYGLGGYGASQASAGAGGAYDRQQRPGSGGPGTVDV